MNVLLCRRKARAAELGRPVGVWIERVDGTELGSRHAARLYMAEVAAEFHRGHAGFTRVDGVPTRVPTSGTLQSAEPTMTWSSRTIMSRRASSSRSSSTTRVTTTRACALAAGTSRSRFRWECRLGAEARAWD